MIFVYKKCNSHFQILDLQHKAFQMNAHDTLKFCALRLPDFPVAVRLDHLTQATFLSLRSFLRTGLKPFLFPTPASTVLAA